MAKKAFPITFTLKHSMTEVIKALTKAEAIQKAFNDSASATEKKELQSLITALKAAEKALDVPCPNGFLYVFTINQSDLGKIGKSES